MNQIKSLAEQIRQRQQQNQPAENPVQMDRKPELSETPALPGDLIGQIRQCGQSEELVQMIHIRLSAKEYRKLITLGAARLSAQKIALYAIRQLLEKDEVKLLLKQLIDDLD